MNENTPPEKISFPAPSLNMAQVIGTLVAIPEVIDLSDSDSDSGDWRVILLQVSTTAYNPRLQRNIADLHRVIAFDDESIDRFKHLPKGAVIQAIGKMQTRRYSDKRGTQKLVTEIVAENIQVIRAHGSNSCLFRGRETTIELEEVPTVPGFDGRLISLQSEIDYRK